MAPIRSVTVANFSTSLCLSFVLSSYDVHCQVAAEEHDWIAIDGSGDRITRPSNEKPSPPISQRGCRRFAGTEACSAAVCQGFQFVLRPAANFKRFLVAEEVPPVVQSMESYDAEARGSHVPGFHRPFRSRENSRSRKL